MTSLMSSLYTFWSLSVYTNLHYTNTSLFGRYTIDVDYTKLHKYISLDYLIKKINV